ncbi:MAG TPA: Na+/H+ antiporter subunit E [Ignavibacteriaceae bacterium]|nr:Na+/H+ antiporter subunit E [Ignavibacteriaceae bacterium]
MNLKLRSRLIVFIFAVLVWLALTDIKSYQEIIAGFIAAVLVTLLAGHFLITTEKSRNILKRLYYLIIYLFRFVWEMIKANLHVAYIVIHPLLPIRPGIVKIKTGLNKDSALTVLSNSITLTPGTMTVDVNEEAKELYIHWIDIKETEVDKATKLISENFEKILREIFE